MAEPKDAFFERSSAVVALCNTQLNAAKAARDVEIAASAAHGAARFSVWSVARAAVTAKELEARKAQAIEAFTNGFREMLEEHFDDYLANHAVYFPPHLQAVNRPVAKR